MSRLLERIENFNKAFALYASAHKAYSLDTNDITKLAIVQAYEIVIELGWKVLKDYLAMQSVIVTTPINTIKEAFSADVISNGQIWIDMIKDRNSSSHEYNSEKADKIIEKISSIYFEELENFSKWLEKAVNNG